MKKNPNIDWNQLQVFLAVAEAGSLTGAKRALSVSQPTLSRQIAFLEESLGVPLFERVPHGLSLTDAGRALVEPARHMQRCAEQVSLRALGKTQELSGTVRLTACEVLSGFFLPDALLPLRETYPEIQIEVIATDDVMNLLARDADIAIRHTPPVQTELIAKNLGQSSMALYAQRGYLEQRSKKILSGEVAGYDWIGLDKSDEYIRGFRNSGRLVDRNFFNFRCDNTLVGWQAALKGHGIAPMFKSIAETFPDMEVFCPEVPIPKVPVWLVSHRELRSNPRIRLVFDLLEKGLIDTMID